MTTTKFTIQGRKMSPKMAAERICKAAELLAKVKKQPSPWHVLNEVLDDMCEPDERGKVKDAVYMKMEGARPN